MYGEVGLKKYSIFLSSMQITIIGCGLLSGKVLSFSKVSKGKIENFSLKL